MHFSYFTQYFVVYHLLHVYNEYKNSTDISDRLDSRRCCMLKETVVAGNWTRNAAETLCRKVMLIDADPALKLCFNVTQTFSEIHSLTPHYSSNTYELETCIADIMVSLF